MLGIKFIKFESTTYVIHYKNGKIANEGKGLSFYYYAPSSSIAAVPVGSSDIPFIFNERTTDFQTISIQGQITYKIENPKQLADMLDFTVDSKGKYRKDDAEKMNQRLINEAQTATSAFIQSLLLKEALQSAKKIEGKIFVGLQEAEAVRLLGVKPMSVNVVAIKATPEMSRALETSTRESLQQEADLAIYQRRNFAVEQERKIKESELNTEIAVEEKKKLIADKKMEAELAKEENNRKLREMQLNTEEMVQNNKNKLRDLNLQADILLEEKRKALIETHSENSKKEADAKKYSLEATLTPYKNMDWKTLMAISGNGTNAKANIAIAFRELAQNAEKIGTLNITPNLLEQMIDGN